MNPRHMLQKVMVLCLCLCVPAVLAPMLVYAVQVQHEQHPNHNYKVFNLQILLKTFRSKVVALFPSLMVIGDPCESQTRK